MFKEVLDGTEISLSFAYRAQALPRPLVPARFSGEEFEHLGYGAWLKDASQDTKVRSGLRRIAEGRFEIKKTRKNDTIEN